ncbi:thioredoxin [Neorhizobium galegae]|uniref:Thioredoxin n=1 Tax=Neorhizobium galegae TaxID=399 RepID=A0A6A1TNM2_NEOGA|nr:thioredoxin domain-containing protein [Neorhizobium galegae]KAB1083539.1 thioredoxin [Neorhizobium galegae]
MTIVKARNGDDFADSVLSSPKPALVFFTSLKCRPTSAIAPLIEDISEELADEMTVVELDIDENPELANRFRVSATPTLAIFNEGKIIGISKGNRPKSALLAFIRGANIIVQYSD